MCYTNSCARLDVGTSKGYHPSLYINRDCISVCRCSCISPDVNSTCGTKIKKKLYPSRVCANARGITMNATSRRFLLVDGDESTFYTFADFIHTNALWRREYVQRFSLFIHADFLRFFAGDALYLQSIPTYHPRPPHTAHTGHTCMAIQFDSINSENENTTNCICTFRVRHFPMLQTWDSLYAS